MKKKTRTMGARKAREWWVVAGINTGAIYRSCETKKAAIAEIARFQSALEVIKVREVLPRRKKR